MLLELLLFLNAEIVTIQSRALRDSVAPKGEQWFHKPAVLILLSESVFLEKEGSPGSWYAPCLLNGSKVR